MKKNIFLFIFLFIIQACVDSNRDFTEEFTLAPGTKVLNKIKVNEVGSIPYDINYNWTLKKLTSITTSNNSSSYTLEYSGNVLKKITQTINQGSQVITTVSNLVYIGGKLTSINGIQSDSQGGSEAFKTTIAYNGNNPQYINKVFQNAALAEESIYLQFNNTNISKINYVLGIGAASINTEVNFSNYDINPNPLHTLPIAFSIADSNLNDETFGILGLSTHNFKTSNHQNNGVENTVYTYSSDGFPIKSVQPDLTLEYAYITL